MFSLSRLQSPAWRRGYLLLAAWTDTESNLHLTEHETLSLESEMETQILSSDCCSALVSGSQVRSEAQTCI